MSTEFWILLGVLIVGFILTWIICSKPVSESDWKEIEGKPGSIYPIARDIKMEMLEAENYRLRRQCEYLSRQNDDLRFRMYGGWDKEALRMLLERPVEVNVDIENIIKVNSEKIN